MMWLILSFASAFLLGFYDFFKKLSLDRNAVAPVLFLITVFLTAIFLPFILGSLPAGSLLEGSVFYVPKAGWEAHRLVLLKSVIVLSSWTFGYIGLKHLPLTIVGPINATQPVMVLLGALLLFGEWLNGYQWIGVLLAVLSFYLLSRSGSREGIDFSHNRWILCVVAGVALGAVSSLYDKYLMQRLSPMFVQAWYVLYQAVLSGIVVLLFWWPRRKHFTPFEWRWSIPCISLFLALADFVYFYALSYEASMISVVSMIRRSSVVVSFLCGALVMHEKNLRSKVIDLILVLLGMVFLYIGSR